MSLSVLSVLVSPLFYFESLLSPCVFCALLPVHGFPPFCSCPLIFSCVSLSVLPLIVLSCALLPLLQTVLCRLPLLLLSCSSCSSWLLLLAGVMVHQDCFSSSALPVSPWRPVFLSRSESQFQFSSFLLFVSASFFFFFCFWFSLLRTFVLVKSLVIISNKFFFLFPTPAVVCVWVLPTLRL